MLVLLPLREVLRNLPWLVVLVLAGSGRGGSVPWVLAGVAVSIVLGTLRWYTTSYRITPAQVQVRRGILRRQVLTVPRDRVRTVDLSANVLHRALGLASLTIGTGRSDRKDDRGLKLDGLGAEAARRLREELLHRPAPLGTEAAGAAAAAVAGPEELARWRLGWIAYGPFTLSGAVTVLVVAGFATQFISDAHLRLDHLGPVRQLGQAAAGSLALVLLVVVLAVLILVGLISTLGYLLSFWHFQLTRDRGTLQVRRGLLTTRVVSIEERRLRGVELSDPLGLRWVRGARCIAIATGLRVGRGAERGGSLLLPPAPRQLARLVAIAIVGDPLPVSCPLLEHGQAARRRRYTRVLLVAVPGLLALLIAWLVAPVPGWALLVALAASLLGWPLAADRYRNLGHAVVGCWLVTRYGTLVRRRCLLRTDGVIGWNLHQTFFQRRAQVVTLVATTAAGRQAYRLQDVTPAEAVAVVQAAQPGLLAPFLQPGRLTDA